MWTWQSFAESREQQAKTCYLTKALQDSESIILRFNGPVCLGPQGLDAAILVDSVIDGVSYSPNKVERSADPTATTDVVLTGFDAALFSNDYSDHTVRIIALPTLIQAAMGWMFRGPWPMTVAMEEL